VTVLVLTSSPPVGPTTPASLHEPLRRRGLCVELPDAADVRDVHVAGVSGASSASVLVADSASGPRAHLLAAAVGASAIAVLDAHPPADGAAPVADAVPSIVDRLA
jgi:hypothetical protein